MTRRLYLISGFCQLSANITYCLASNLMGKFRFMASLFRCLFISVEIWTLNFIHNNQSWWKLQKLCHHIGSFTFFSLILTCLSRAWRDKLLFSLQVNDFRSGFVWFCASSSSSSTSPSSSCTSPPFTSTRSSSALVREQSDTFFLSFLFFFFFYITYFFLCSSFGNSDGRFCLGDCPLGSRHLGIRGYSCCWEGEQKKQKFTTTKKESFINRKRIKEASLHWVLIGQ